MKTNKKLKIIISVIVLVCFVGTYVIMYCNVNAKYPQNKMIVVESGKTFTTQNVNITVDDAYMLNVNQIKQDKDLYNFINNGDDTLLEDKYYTLAIIDITIKNPSNKKIKLDMTAFHFESNSYSSQFYYPFMLYYNGFGMYPELKPNETKKIKLVDSISPIVFLDFNYDKFMNSDYYITCSMYPEKLMAKVKFN